MNDNNDGTDGGDGNGYDGDGRRGWPADYRVAFAELPVEFKELEGQMRVDYERFSKEAAERETRLTNSLTNRMLIAILGIVGIATGVLSILITSN